MPDMTNEQLTEFCNDLKHFRASLASPKQVLLDAILEFAWNCTAEGESLERGFDGCFEPGQVKAIFAYHGGEPVAANPSMIRSMMIRHHP